MKLILMMMELMILLNGQMKYTVLQAMNVHLQAIQIAIVMKLVIMKIMKIQLL